MRAVIIFKDDKGIHVVDKEVPKGSPVTVAEGKANLLKLELYADADVTPSAAVLICSEIKALTEKIKEFIGE